jgi:hypothetical protein
VCFPAGSEDLLQGEIGLTAAQRLQVTGLAQNRRNPNELLSFRRRMLGLLTDLQKRKLAALELSIRLADEAIDFGLIPRPPGGEALCN